MIVSAIDFPNLNPAAITLPLEFDMFGAHLGPFPLRWYALAYIAGLMLGWRWIVHLIRSPKVWGPNRPTLSATMADDFLVWATLGVILGGRLGYILFYVLTSESERPKLFHDPGMLFRIWEGGMSFHGGLIGVALATWWFTRQLHVDEDKFAKIAKEKARKEKPKADERGFIEVKDIGWLTKGEYEATQDKTRTFEIDMLRLGDLAAAATPIGLFFGRIANFINAELYGRVTDAPWGMRFPAGGYNWTSHTWQWNYQELPRHPSQLYEAFLEGIVLFAIINFATFKFKSLQRPGLNVGLFLTFYGLFRAMTEFVREPDQQMPDFLRQYVTMGMLLSTPMILIGLWLVWRTLKGPAPDKA